MKTQFIRIIDVIFVGPLMITAASRFKMPEIWRAALAVTGVATIIYNGANWLEQQEIDNATTRQ